MAYFNPESCPFDDGMCPAGVTQDFDLYGSFPQELNGANESGPSQYVSNVSQPQPLSVHDNPRINIAMRDINFKKANTSTDLGYATDFIDPQYLTTDSSLSTPFNSGLDLNCDFSNSYQSNQLQPTYTANFPQSSAGYADNILINFPPTGFDDPLMDLSHISPRNNFLGRPSTTVLANDPSHPRPQKRHLSSSPPGPSQKRARLAVDNAVYQPIRSQISDQALSQFQHWIQANPGTVPTDKQLQGFALLTDTPVDTVRDWFQQQVQDAAERDSAYGTSDIHERVIMEHAVFRDKCTKKKNKEEARRKEHDPKKPYSCTSLCGQTFKDKDDWRKHEEINRPQTGFVCDLGRVWNNQCTFCGEENPSEEHFLDKHKGKAPCCEKEVKSGNGGRVFYRAQHLKQHLDHLHTKPLSENWKSLAEEWRVPLPNNFGPRCGFCGLHFKSWQHRICHVADHFTDRIPNGPWTMSRWRDPWKDDSEATQDGSDDDSDNKPDNNDYDDGTNEESGPSTGFSSDWPDNGFDPDGDCSGSGGDSAGLGYQPVFGSYSHPHYSGYWACQHSDCQKQESQTKCGPKEDTRVTSILNDPVHYPTTCSLESNQQNQQSKLCCSYGHGQKSLNELNSMDQGNDPGEVVNRQGSSPKELSSNLESNMAVGRSEDCNMVIKPVRWFSLRWHSRKEGMDPNMHSALQPISYSSQTAEKLKDNPTLSSEQTGRPEGTQAERVEVTHSEAAHALKTRRVDQCYPIPGPVYHHHYFNDRTSLPFVHARILGYGASSVVDEVTFKDGQRPLARKIYSSITLHKYGTLQRSFRREINILQQLQHPHIVRFSGWYSGGGQHALLMTPVADCSLMDFLNATSLVESTLDSRYNNIHGWFNCLVSGLEYMHRNQICHGDLKPANILVKDNDVFFTDFGVSRYLSDGQNLGSTGGPMTRMYAAPEMASEGIRGKTADIFSLGCVFLEMITVMSGKSISELHSHLAIGKNPQLKQEKPYRKNINAAQEWTTKCYLFAAEKFGYDNSYQLTPEQSSSCRQMLEENPKSRPTALGLLAKFSPQPCCVNGVSDVLRMDVETISTQSPMTSRLSWIETQGKYSPLQKYIEGWDFSIDLMPHYSIENGTENWSETKSKYSPLQKYIDGWDFSIDLMPHCSINDDMEDTAGLANTHPFINHPADPELARVNSLWNHLIPVIKDPWSLISSFPEIDRENRRTWFVGEPTLSLLKFGPLYITITVKWGYLPGAEDFSTRPKSESISTIALRDAQCLFNSTSPWMAEDSPIAFVCHTIGSLILGEIRIPYGSILPDKRLGIPASLTSSPMANECSTSTTTSGIIASNFGFPRQTRHDRVIHEGTTLHSFGQSTSVASNEGTTAFRTSLGNFDLIGVGSLFKQRSDLHSITCDLSVPRKLSRTEQVRDLEFRKRIGAQQHPSEEAGRENERDIMKSGEKSLSIIKKLLVGGAQQTQKPNQKSPRKLSSDVFGFLG
ncbi:MAG: hypothetical protein M1834_007459 [Cirrosporium novae-zelandiae]|nr:MAG: hypothetical protein M1834_007459 [Cirrosporium novae-zelandiae]